MDTIFIKLNQETVSANTDDSILTAALRHGVEIPHVCYEPMLGPLQTCDTCLVELDGVLVRACATTLYQGASVETRTDHARAAQIEAAQRILQNHQLYCTVCDNNNGDCVVHNTIRDMGIQHQKYSYTDKPYPATDETNPFYRYDVNQCILCGRCVEACQDVEVNETLSIDWTLERPRVVWDQNVPIGESSCVSCGHCVTVCPCNALMEKTMLGEAGYLTATPSRTLIPMIEFVEDIEPSLPPVFALSDIEREMRKSRIKVTKTVCTYCGVGCSFDIWTHDRQILKVQPPDEAPVNGISTCVKGKFGWDFVNDKGRLMDPLIREGDHFRTASWEEALTLVARRFGEIKDQYGPDALMMVASSKGSNEEAYLVQKFARHVIGTNNVDNDSTYCQDPATYGLRETVGYGADSGSLTDIAAADMVLIIGSNTAESHPVFATRIKRAHKLRGQKLVVVDVRKHEMADRADLFVSPRPGTDAAWILGLSRYLIDQDWIDHDFVERAVEGFDVYRHSLEPYTLEETERLTGVPAETTQTVARMIHESPRFCVLWAMGVTQQRDGSEGSLAIANLLLLTGNFGRPGTGGYPLRGHNNVQGASDAGAKPKFLPGYQDPDDPVVRQRFEAAWGGTLPSAPGVNNQQIAGAIHAGKLRALYIVGEDTALVDANATDARQAFESLDFLVVQEIFLTRTAQYADVVLPACPSLEKEGTFTNTERRIQRFYQAMGRLGQSRPDWVILRDLAHRMGVTWPDYQHPAEIMDEMVALTPLFAGVTYDRLAGYHTLQWPVASDGVDTPLLYCDGFPSANGKAQLVPMSLHGPNQENPRYDIHVNNGQILEHFHEGNMTYRIPGIEHLVPQVFLEVSSDLAHEKGLENGTQVRLVSPTGEVEVPILITDRVTGYTAYLPMNAWGEGAINNITGMGIDEKTDTPAFKDTRAYLEIVRKPPKSWSPLPRYNWRFQQRCPQPGVRVARKWARPDYVPLTPVNRPNEPGRPANPDDPQ